MKSQFKIALYLIIANTLMLFFFGGSVYYFSYNYSYTDFYKRLETRAEITARYNFELDDVSSESVRMIREEHLEKMDNEKEYIFQVNSIDSLPQIAKQSSLPLQYIKEVFVNKKANHQVKNTFYSGVKHSKNNKTHLVIISAENYYATHHLRLLKNVIFGSFLFIILFTISFSFYFSKQVFNPMKKITDKVNEISSDNIHLRLDETDRDDEISQLINTFNSLLNRLETSFETQKNFISNASHEFGTPLTAIIGEADVALRKERSNEEYREAIGSILIQAERLNQISQSLLYLAQTGYKKNHPNFEILRSDELILQTKEIVDKLIPKNNIHIGFDLLPENPLKLKIFGNKQLLTLAFVNIITNACKYSNNKFVEINLAAGDNQILLIFKDQGIGIPESELPYIYDPFFRASNTNQYDGYGIGLPLARNIIKIHNGQLFVSSLIGKGTTVQIKIPVAKIESQQKF